MVEASLLTTLGFEGKSEGKTSHGSAALMTLGPGFRSLGHEITFANVAHEQSEPDRMCESSGGNITVS